ncbi:MAG: LacI family DNA-binding transcriptional regulator [Anaerolineae bacterium]
MHVTLRDVAKLAGVSTKTVSRVVNNQGEISESTRARVQSAIAKLGYRPNILARSLVSQRTDTLGVVAWGIDYYGPSQTVVGIENRADELGYSLFLHLLTKPDEAKIERVMDTLIDRRVDGVIWAVPEVGDNRAWIETDRLSQLPPIVFLSTLPRQGLASISIDNYRGALQATQHLIAQGRRRIAMIAGPTKWWEARERQAGWRAALTEAGLSTEASLVADGDWSAQSGAQAMKTLLAREPHIDAVFACSDQIALGALGALHQAGRRVPHDVAIVGFDNIPESAFFWPPLTTVYQQLTDVGCLAVEKLHQMIEWQRKAEPGEPPEATILTPELIVRQSSAA